MLRRIPFLAACHSGGDHRRPPAFGIHSAIRHRDDLLIGAAPCDLGIRSRILGPILRREIDALSHQQRGPVYSVRIGGIWIRQFYSVNRRTHPDLTNRRFDRIAACFGCFRGNDRLALAGCIYYCSGGILRIRLDFRHLSIGRCPCNGPVRRRIVRNISHLKPGRRHIFFQL